MAAKKKKPAKKKPAKKKKKAGKKPTNPTGKGSKTTAATHREHVDATEELLLELKTPGEVKVALALRFDMSERSVEEWISQVDKRWAADSAETRELSRARAVRRIFKLMADATKDHGFRLQCEKLLARIQGTLAPERSEVWEIDPTKLTDGQLTRIIEGEDPAVVLGTPATVH